MEVSNERIDLINIEDEMQRAYIDYSMSVIIGRALPDARDGLKPGNRRILYAMKERGWTHNKAYVKCAKVVGEVIEKIDRLGIGDETLLIVTSDHGQEFFEHGEKGHQKSLYDEVLRIPLVMRWPKGLAAGQVLETPVSLVDLTPSICDLIGVAPPPDMEGRSLVSVLHGQRDSAPAVFAHLYGRKKPKNWD